MLLPLVVSSTSWCRDELDEMSQRRDEIREGMMGKCRFQLMFGALKSSPSMMSWVSGMSRREFCRFVRYARSELGGR